MNSTLIKQLIARFHCRPEWAVFFEVHNGTGAIQRRSADAIAMNMYPSRGLAIHGFEIKVSRGDWLNELKKPDKAEEIAQYCDYWWIVTPPGIVKEGELPPSWGHYEVVEDKAMPDSIRLKRKVAAPPLVQFRPTQQLSRSFVAAVLRRANEFTDAEFDAACEKKIASHIKHIDMLSESRIKHETDNARRLKERIDEIRNISGIDLNTWDATEKVGLAIKLVMKLGITNVYSDIYSLAQTLEKITKEFKDASDGLRKHIPIKRKHIRWPTQ